METLVIIFAWILAGSFALTFVVAGLAVLVNRVMEAERASRAARTHQST